MFKQLLREAKGAQRANWHIVNTDIMHTKIRTYRRTDEVICGGRFAPKNNCSFIWLGLVCVTVCMSSLMYVCYLSLRSRNVREQRPKERVPDPLDRIINSFQLLLPTLLWQRFNETRAPMSDKRSDIGHTIFRWTNRQSNV